MVMTTAMTAAKIGRVMKKRDRRMFPVPRRERREVSESCVPALLRERGLAGVGGATSGAAAASDTGMICAGERLHLRPGHRHLRASDHHAVCRALARTRITRRPSTIGPSWTGLRRHRAVPADHQHGLARLVGDDRSVGNHQRGRGATASPAACCRTCPASGTGWDCAAPRGRGSCRTSCRARYR